MPRSKTCNRAQDLDLETNQEVMRLVSARVVKARDGGVLISGDEMHFRASKDKGRAWWCVPPGAEGSGRDVALGRVGLARGDYAPGDLGTDG